MQKGAKSYVSFVLNIAMRFDFAMENIFCRPESMGVLIACVYLVAMFLFIPIPFTLDPNSAMDVQTGGKPATFPHEEVGIVVCI